MDVIKHNKGFCLLFFSVAVASIGLFFLGIPFQFLLFPFAALLFLISFVNTNFALIILIFSMLFSPEFEIGVIPGRPIIVRLDDLFLGVVFFGWLAKMAINKELGLLRITPINKSIIAYIGICLLSSGIGVLRDTTDFTTTIFYNLKYIEYFLIFFLVSNNIRNKKQVKIFLFFMLFVCFLVSVYGINRHLAFGERATAPFEGEMGEPNTLASYLVMMMGITLGLFVYARSIPLNFLFGGFSIFLIFPLLYTLSRTGWFGSFAMYLAILIISKRKRIFLFVCLIIMSLSFPFILPQEVIHRFKEAFNPSSYGRNYDVFGKRIRLDDSAALRIESMQGSLKTWWRFPILGLGVPAKGVVSDVQHTRILREVGIVGYLIFIWMMLSLYKASQHSLGDTHVDDFGKGLSLGFISAVVSLFVMGAAAEVFIIIRVMEPFWFLAGIVVVLPEISVPAQTPVVEE